MRSLVRLDGRRPAGRGAWPLLCVLFAGCALATPSNDRRWAADQVILPTAEFNGSAVTVHNIRACDYRSADNYTVRHYDKTFDLDDLDSVDFVVVPFPEIPSLAHTMLSFGFKRRDYLALSVEIRKRQGEEYAPVKGALGYFELMYVLGDERDLIALRSNHRRNEVYLYRSRATPEQGQALFVDVLKRVNQLAAKPELYNTLTNNCTTNLWRHVNKVVAQDVPYDWRLLLPGYSDQLAYDRGLLETHGSFEETREQARITYQAYLHRDSPDFSTLIRR